VTDAIALAVADTAQCAIRADHTLWCWGNSSSALFVPRLELEEVPPTRVPIDNVAAMSMVRDNICIARTDGTVACWGANSEGQLGDGTFFTRNRPSNVMGITDAVGVFVGLGFACAVHEDGGVSCWGSTDHGQIGTYATINVEKPQAAIWP
jgi:alpha-tubulin suppressor-like RCC1 family protein